MCENHRVCYTETRGFDSPTASTGLKARSHQTTPSLLTGGTFDLFDGHCDGQNGLHNHLWLGVNEPLQQMCNTISESKLDTRSIRVPY